MITPDIPQNEESRVRTLKSLNILDTLPEERFDRLTRMSKRLFGVPIALVSLVDENRQWFKSSMGLDVSETPRDISFCGHTILGNDVMVIPDAASDIRFADNPLVVNFPNIRFYAGCPLKSVNGCILGTLCIIDKVPRVFNEEDIEILKDLASMVEDELEAIQMATLDELTKISNRRGFLLLAEHYLNFCLRQDVPASLVYLDLNGFKQINDNFGHAEGDAVLVAFASQMKNSFRQTDLFARIGGDEFVILFSKTSEIPANDIMKKFSKSIEKYNEEANRGYDISFSYGVIEFDPDRHVSVDIILGDADSLMYERKKQRGDVVSAQVISVSM